MSLPSPPPSPHAGTHRGRHSFTPGGLAGEEGGGGGCFGCRKRHRGNILVVNGMTYRRALQCSAIGGNPAVSERWLTEIQNAGEASQTGNRAAQLDSAPISNYSAQALNEQSKAKFVVMDAAELGLPPAQAQEERDEPAMMLERPSAAVLDSLIKASGTPARPESKIF